MQMGLENLRFYVEVSLVSQQVSLVTRIPEDDVALLIRLEVPRTYENHVALTHPDPLLHLTPHTADAHLAVLALDVHARLTIVLDHDTENIVLVGVHHPFADVYLSLYQLLTQCLNPRKYTPRTF
jgi:hypothetical protein